MKRLVIVASGRGGVGKSTTCRFTGEWLRDEKPGDTLLADGDGQVGQMLQFLGKRGDDGEVLDPQPPDGVRVFALHDERARGQLVDLLDAGKSSVLVDLPAASLGVLKKIDVEYGLRSLAGTYGYAVTLVTLITPYQASILDVVESLEFGDREVSRLIVRNLGLGSAEDFELFNGTEVEKMAKEAGALVVDLPPLRPAIAALIDRESVSFGKAANLQTSPLKLSYRGAVAQWIALARASFEPAREILGLDSGEPSAASKKSREREALLS